MELITNLSSGRSLINFTLPTLNRKLTLSKRYFWVELVKSVKNQFRYTIANQLAKLVLKLNPSYQLITGYYLHDDENGVFLKMKFSTFQEAASFNEKLDRSGKSVKTIFVELNGTLVPHYVFYDRFQKKVPRT